MVNIKQKIASKRNIKLAQKKWKSLTTRQRTLAQPQGKDRLEPGSTGKGQYYRIVIRDEKQFTSFKNHDVGKKGGIQRIAGRRQSGSWDTQAWLISKDIARKINGRINTDDIDVQNVLDTLGSKPKYIKGDIFKAKPTPNIAEKDKPTKKQKEAYTKNIKKAQEKRWGKKT